MAVSGVFSSCDTLETNSRRIFSRRRSSVTLWKTSTTPELGFPGSRDAITATTACFRGRSISKAGGSPPESTVRITSSIRGCRRISQIGRPTGLGPCMSNKARAARLAKSTLWFSSAATTPSTMLPSTVSRRSVLSCNWRPLRCSSSIRVSNWPFIESMADSRLRGLLRGMPGEIQTGSPASRAAAVSARRERRTAAIRKTPHVRSSPNAATLNVAPQISPRTPVSASASRPKPHAAQAATIKYPTAAVQKIRDENMSPFTGSRSNGIARFSTIVYDPPPFGLDPSAAGTEA